MFSAISAISSASVPDETPSACRTSRRSASSRSSASTSAPRMNCWLSHMRVTAARTSARMGANWAVRSSSGTRKDWTSVLDDDGRVAHDGEVPGSIVAVAGEAGVGVDDQVHLLPRVGGEVGGDRDPAAIAGVVRGVDVLVHHLVVLAAIGNADAEEDAITLFVPGFFLDPEPCAEPAVVRDRDLVGQATGGMHVDRVPRLAFDRHVLHGEHQLQRAVRTLL